MYSNSSGLLTKHEVKLAGYTCMEKKEQGQYPAILTKQAWSIKDLNHIEEEHFFLVGHSG